MRVERRETSFEDVMLFAPEVYEDNRGLLFESFSIGKYAKLGLIDTFVQDLVTRSSKHVLRGPHYDLRMAKFVQVLMGQVFDVVIDVRAGSPTYKKWEGFSLSSENHFQLYIPRGFAHGFLTLTDDVVFLYKMSVQHDPDHEKQLHWLDPALAIPWPVREGVRVSQKDSNEANYLV